MKEIPNVLAEEQEDGTLIVRCPYCRRGRSKKDAIHSHGVGGGLRLSHCWNATSPHYNRQINLYTREDEMRWLAESIPSSDSDQ